MSEEKQLPYMKKGPTDCWKWKGDPKTAPNKDKLMACRNPLCCNPDHIVKDKAGNELPNVESPENKAKKVSAKTGKS